MSVKDQDFKALTNSDCVAHRSSLAHRALHSRLIKGTWLTNRTLVDQANPG